MILFADNERRTGRIATRFLRRHRAQKAPYARCSRSGYNKLVCTGYDSRQVMQQVLTHDFQLLLGLMDGVGILYKSADQIADLRD